MRKAALLLAAVGLLLLGAVPAGAAGWTERVTLQAESATSGGGLIYFSGTAVGSDIHAGGTIAYSHPYQANYQWELNMRLENLQCLVVEPTTHPTRPADHNVFVVGRLAVTADSDDRIPDGDGWGVFVYYPDDTRHGSARPFSFWTHDEKPSCDPDVYFYWTPDGVWHSSGYLLAGHVNVTVR